MLSSPFSMEKREPGGHMLNTLVRARCRLEISFNTYIIEMYKKKKKKGFVFRLHA